jgi:hypothetical protein
MHTALGVIFISISLIAILYCIHRMSGLGWRDLLNVLIVSAITFTLFFLMAIGLTLLGF